MEGGAMRGLFTCGVIDVLMENSITFDGGIGVSAGAVFGCNYKSQQIGRPYRYNTLYCNDPRYCSIRSLITTGDLYGADFCYRELPDRLDIFDTETFNNNPMEFYVVATDLKSGKPVYHKCSEGKENDIQWMRASASMPLVSRPVEIEGKVYLDGGMSDSIPFAYFESIGYKRNLVILTQPRDYVKKYNPAAALMRLLMKDYPKVAEVMSERHNIYNQQLEDLRKSEKEGLAFVISPPSPLNIGRVEKDPNKLRQVYRIGRQTAVSHLNEIISFLNQ